MGKSAETDSVELKDKFSFNPSMDWDDEDEEDEDDDEDDDDEDEDEDEDEDDDDEEDMFYFDTYEKVSVTANTVDISAEAFACTADGVVINVVGAYAFVAGINVVMSGLQTLILADKGDMEGIEENLSSAETVLGLIKEEVNGMTTESDVTEAEENASENETGVNIHG